ncbi:hypothetical protein ACPV5S_15745 [Vibrio astriarenae]
MNTDNLALNDEELSLDDAQDSQVGRDNYERFNSAFQSGHAEYVESALKYDRMYIGEQWNKEDKAKLDSEGRPALTLNMILSTVNAMIGEQLDRKVEVHFKPRKDGSEETAFALNRLTRFILNQNCFDDVEEEVFADGLIQDRGYYDIRMDFTTNIDGDICISAEDPVDVIPDPEAKSPDPAKWNEVFISRWMTPDKIAEYWGEQEAERVRQKFLDGNYSHNHCEYQSRTFGDENEIRNTDDERTIKRVRIVERQFYRMDTVDFIIDPDTGDMRQAPRGLSGDEVKAFAKKHGYQHLAQHRRRVRQVISVGELLLHDDWSIYRTFTIVPFFPYFRRGNPFGVVRNLVDSQELLNKTSSQELHIVNTTANSGWVVEEDSLANMETDDLEHRGSETGLVVSYKRNRQKPEKITPNQIPTGIDRISMKALNTIREISSVNKEMQGMARADQSGKAIEHQTARGQVQVSVVLNNLTRARRMIANKILELIQDFYTETRFFKVADDGPMGEMGEEEHFINGMDLAGNILNDVTRGQYDTVVGFVPTQGTEHDAQFAEATRLRELGVQIPDHILIEYSNLHRRKEVSEVIKRMQGFAEPTPEEQQLMEFQQMAEIESIRKGLEKMDAEIEALRAKAAKDAADGGVKEGYNDKEMEITRMEHERELRLQELSLRLALAARSGQNQRAINTQRSSTQVALKMMDNATQRYAIEQQQEKSQQED